MDAWCSFCDAILRSGAWVANIDGTAERACPECGTGWDSFLYEYPKDSATTG